MRILGTSEGSGILQVLFIALTGSIVALSISKMTSDSSLMSRFVSGKSDREIIVQNILMNTDCAASFPSTPGCADGAYVNLVAKSGGGTILVRADGTTVQGGFNIRARCVNQPATATFGLDIRAARLSSAAAAGDPRLDFGHQDSKSFRREPVSNLSLTWSHPKAALFSSPGLAPCAAAIGGTTAQLTCVSPQVQIGLKPNGRPLCGPVPTPVPGSVPASCVVVPQLWYRGNAAYASWTSKPAPAPAGCPAGYGLVSSLIIDQKQQSFSSTNPKSGHTAWTETLFQRGLLCCK